MLYRSFSLSLWLEYNNHVQDIKLLIQVLNKVKLICSFVIGYKEPCKVVCNLKDIQAVKSMEDRHGP